MKGRIQKNIVDCIYTYYHENLKDENCGKRSNIHVGRTLNIIEIRRD